MERYCWWSTHCPRTGHLSSFPELGHRVTGINYGLTPFRRDVFQKQSLAHVVGTGEMTVGQKPQDGLALPFLSIRYSYDWFYSFLILSHFICSWNGVPTGPPVFAWKVSTRIKWSEVGLCPMRQQNSSRMVPALLMRVLLPSLLLRGEA